MSKLSKLLQVTEEEKNAILMHYGLTEAKFEENVQMLKEWIHKCDHLPNEENEHKFRIVLLNSKMSLERAKEVIEGYYQIKTRYSEEMFDKMIPNTKEYNECKKVVKTVIMPKLTPNLCRITIFKISDPNGEANDAYMYQILALMMAEMRIANDFCLSNILIIDFEEYGWKNFIKFTPSVNQKLVDMLLSVNLRIHSIHFINQPNIMDQIMWLIKSLVPGKIVSKIHSHKSYESLMDHVPREYLPSDYGGNEKSVDELYDEWCEQIEESEEIFQKLLNLKSTKKIELDPLQAELFGCGAEGSFRQLCLD